ncbi:hypothetical protein FACS18948_4690 [Clostridia bacterium]|nr:hypothetical protein FACS18948_4690 [Clostridia bacterium]
MKKQSVFFPVTNALKIFLYAIGAAVAALLFAPILLIENDLARMLINILYIVGVAYLFQMSGASKGFADSSSDGLRKKNNRDEKVSYIAVSAFAAAIIAALPWVIIGIIGSVGAKPYTYTLQDLPSWLSAYRHLPEVGAPLAYYNETVVITIDEWLRVISRFISMPYVNLFSGAGNDGAFMFDKLAFIPPFIWPLSYALGYLRGPALYRREQSAIASAKAKPKLRLKKNAKDKKNKSREPERLV